MVFSAARHSASCLSSSAVRKTSRARQAFSKRSTFWSFSIPPGRTVAPGIMSSERSTGVGSYWLAAASFSSGPDASAHANSTLLGLSFSIFSLLLSGSSVDSGPAGFDAGLTLARISAAAVALDAPFSILSSSATFTFWLSSDVFLSPVSSSLCAFFPFPFLPDADKALAVASTLEAAGWTSTPAAFDPFPLREVPDGCESASCFAAHPLPSAWSCFPALPLPLRPALDGCELAVSA
mmetsp:Transcript_81332/g.144053  ORF Transcript_81332/g.144053 Transcript_81332/m.144053 type:complete len:237 (-) Transcript_81332:271-981(-)